MKALGNGGFKQPGWYRTMARRLFDRLPVSEATKSDMKTALRVRFRRGRDDTPNGPNRPTATEIFDDREGRAVSKLDFKCNVCGTDVIQCPVEQIDREVASCHGCGSSVRMRSIVHLLSLGLHGKSIPLPDWPVNHDVKGIGLSDWTGYASRLPRKVDYKNSYFHTEPYLDICNPPADYAGKFNFLISTEVFEHVPPPASRAFEAAYRLLKPGGILVFTVPYSHQPDTLEHFPELHKFEIVTVDGDYVMVNKRRDGSFELFTKLAFHGGPGTTLEMRVFSRAAILRHLENAGFQDVTIMEQPYLEMGIIHNYPWSLPILARKPAVL